MEAGAVLESESMVKPKGRPKTRRDDATTKFDRRLLGMAQMIAKDRGITAAEYLSEMCRKQIEREAERLLSRFRDDKGGES
jgi:hypothetical protein